MKKVLPINIRAMKKYRLIAGISASELARRIGVKRQSISMYEQGKSMHNGDRLLRICGELCCAPEDIIKCNGEIE